ncbi:hypothetical protein IFM89_030979 [Coptis chinensis]|uniref:Histone H4 n=1 Tax=Coptis chinensis TaxID=261450 RepID=A0A835H9X1_9MAGN|nr:hypothetical protein IFM89_030979 [Coptis chinensis]
MGFVCKKNRKVLRDNIQGITKSAIRRLARRGGVKHISGMIYEETKGTMDVVYALKRQGRTQSNFDCSHFVKMVCPTVTVEKKPPP